MATVKNPCWKNKKVKIDDVGTFKDTETAKIDVNERACCLTGPQIIEVIVSDRHGFITTPIKCMYTCSACRVVSKPEPKKL